MGQDAGEAGRGLPVEGPTAHMLSPPRSVRSRDNNGYGGVLAESFYVLKLCNKNYFGLLWIE